MKIIDLLQMIANGEEDLPKKFKFNGEMFEMTEFGSYADRDGDSIFDSLCTDFSNINDEVEIIEEETKPITKESIEALGYACGEIQKCFTNGWNKSLENKPLEDNKIEKLEQRIDTGLMGSESTNIIEHTNRINRQAGYLSDIVSKVNELIDKVNNMEDNK